MPQTVVRIANAGMFNIFDEIPAPMASESSGS